MDNYNNLKEEYFQKLKKSILLQLKYAKKNIPYFKEKLKNVDLNLINYYEDFLKKNTTNGI